MVLNNPNLRLQTPPLGFTIHNLRFNTDNLGLFNDNLRFRNDILGFLSNNLGSLTPNYHSTTVTEVY